MTQSKTQIIAHRGDSGAAPENTLAAFREALRIGADGVEFDVQRASDGIPVVIHDHTLERTTTGSGAVAAHTARELASLDAGAWFGADFAGEGVPTLEQVLELLGPSGMALHLELKTGEQPDPELVEAALHALARAETFLPGLTGRLVISSFQHKNLEAVRRLEPRIACAALVGDNDPRPWDTARALGCAGVHPPVGVVDAALVRSAHGAGLAVRPWTVDDPEAAARLLGWGVDGIITNQPGRLMALRDDARN